MDILKIGINQFEAKFGKIMQKPRGNFVLTEEDVLKSLQKIEEFKDNEIKKILPLLHKTFLDEHIITKEDLEQLISSETVISTLKDIYMDELGRFIDPLAIAVYGSPLYFYGTRAEVISAIRIVIRKSDEYKLKHKY